MISANLLYQNGKADYICVDRSRKNAYLNDSKEFVKEITCNKLIHASLSAIPYIMNRYQTSNGDDTHKSEQTEINTGRTKLCKIDTDRNKFVA